ncbi:hypothetical protein PG999_012760 [Apiospora kogelbergensis]|uniref:Uncharacterized protein n=1 Tax=Apiospora kogelbergensis TaxID=1337665 RepID=A0AAW0QBV7_9PEZI
MQLLSYNTRIATAAALVFSITAASPTEDGRRSISATQIVYPTTSCLGLGNNMATTTTATGYGVCRMRYICPEPTSACAPGEPTRAYPSQTVTRSCRTTVVVHRTCGCPSCTPTQLYTAPTDSSLGFTTVFL